MDGVKELINTAKKEKINDGSPGRILSYWLRAFEEVKTGKDTDYMEEICLSIGEIYANEKLYEPALKYYQNLETHFDIHENTLKEKIEVFDLIGNAYSNLSKPDSAYFYYQKILKLHQKENNLSAQINLFRKVVKNYSLNKDHENALRYNLKIKQLLEQSNAPSENLLVVYNNLGYNYNFLKNYELAIQYFKQALSLNLEKDKITKTTLSMNIGIAYYNLGDFQTSIDHLLSVQKERTEINQLLATVYLEKQDLYNARSYVDIGYEKAHQEKNAELLSEICYTAAQIHTQLYEYDRALEYFQEHLSLRDSLQFEERFRQESLRQHQFSLERIEREVRLFIIDQEIQELSIAQLKLEADKQQLALDNLKLEDDRKEKELSILRKDKEIKESKLANQLLEAQRTKQELQLAKEKLLNVEKENALAAQKEKEARFEEVTNREIERQEMLLKEEQKEKELYKMNDEISRLEIEKQKGVQRFLFGIGALLGLISLLVFGSLIYSRKINKKLSQKNQAIEQQKEEIAIERNKSEKLLLNILPVETANELKEKGFATPKKYDKATVIFTDFSGFTEIANKMSPEELIAELNTCFEAFDEIIGQYGLEKIKTIGDAYMCVAGIPAPTENNPINAIAAGLEMMKFMNQRIQQKQSKGLKYWGMRMGIHSGPIVAGVIGQKKFAYDIWGDTVNIASRMEANGAIGKINISKTTYELVKHKYKCIARDLVDVQNLGKITMYFVDA